MIPITDTILDMIDIEHRTIAIDEALLFAFCFFCSACDELLLLNLIADCLA